MLSIRNNFVCLKYKLKKDEVYRVLKNDKYYSIYIFKKPQIVTGISNFTQDNKAILFIDYDNVELNIIEEDYKFVQEKFKLPPAYLFGTKAGNYHLICLKKFLNGEIYNILLHTRCDENYKDSPIKNNYRSYVIRLSDKIGSKKPKFIKMMGYNLHRQYEISSAHLKLLSKLYKDIPKIEYSNEDKLDEVRLHKYETSI